MKKYITILIGSAIMFYTPAIQAGLFDMVSNLGKGGGGSDQNILNDAKAYADGKPEKLRPFYAALYAEGEWNAVFNYNHLGLAAMELGDYEVAKRSFDQSISRIFSIYANDENAKRARGVFGEEKNKDWKGEPYERAMAYYYRGVLYANDGDYENAAASFRGAAYQSSLSESEEFKSDFGLMDYLAAWSKSCAGDQSKASELLSQAQEKEGKFNTMPMDSRFLLLIEAGLAPTKQAAGKYNEKLVIKAPDSTVAEVISIDDPTGQLNLSSPVLSGDIQHQASTRGGRAFDAILNGKAEFKGTADTVADIGMQVGSGLIQSANMQSMMGNQDSANNMANAGLFGMLIGAGAKIAAAAVTATADTRAWGSLPSSVYIVQGKDIPSVESIKIGVGENKFIEPRLPKSNNQCAISWVKTKSALMPQDGGTASVHVPPIIEEGVRKEKNAQFRNMLSSF